VREHSHEQRSTHPWWQRLNCGEIVGRSVGLDPLGSPDGFPVGLLSRLALCSGQRRRAVALGRVPLAEGCDSRRAAAARRCWSPRLAAQRSTLPRPRAGQLHRRRQLAAGRLKRLCGRLADPRPVGGRKRCGKEVQEVVLLDGVDPPSLHGCHDGRLHGLAHARGGGAYGTGRFARSIARWALKASCLRFSVILWCKTCTGVRIGWGRRELAPPL
jgi:hypothetical protein